MSSHTTIPKIKFTQQLLYFNMYLYPVTLLRILSGMCYKVRSVQCMKTPSTRQTSKLGKREAALNTTIHQPQPAQLQCRAFNSVSDISVNTCHIHLRSH